VALLLPRSEASPIDVGGNSPSALAKDGDATLGVVLLVEDNAQVGALVMEMLTELGYEVLRVASADAALGALADGRKIDVVFSDVMMPGTMNGIELARKLKQERPDLPVLLSSGYAEPNGGCMPNVLKCWVNRTSSPIWRKHWHGPGQPYEGNTSPLSVRQRRSAPAGGSDRPPEARDVRFCIQPLLTALADGTSLVQDRDGPATERSLTGGLCFCNSIQLLP
jgi:CheY-like chemotaxis protein